jgi:hypothetical protein
MLFIYILVYKSISFTAQLAEVPFKRAIPRGVSKVYPEVLTVAISKCLYDNNEENKWSK